MKAIRWATATCCALTVVLAVTQAHAACNAFPSARPGYVEGLHVPPSAEQVLAASRAALMRASAPLPYLGPVGRFANLSFEPGSIAIVATDTTCAGPIYSVPVEARPSFETRWLDKLVGVVVTRPGGSRPPLVRVYTQARTGGHDAPMLCGLRKAFADTGIRPLDDCAQATMRTVPTGPEKAALGIPLPSEKDLLGIAKAKTTDEPSHNVAFTLMAMALPESPAELAAIVRRIHADGCVQSCRDFVSPAGSRGALCIDEVIDFGWNRISERVAYLNEGFPDCDHKGPTLTFTGPVNTFKNICEIDHSGGNRCADPPTDKTLSMRQDSCGRLHIPFKWDGVFVDTPVVVAGQSATSRKTQGGENRIWVPGREFVGSTPTAAGNGGGTDIDWRKPDITVWYPTSTEFGLKGVVDKTTPSTVHIFPNYEVRVLCDKPSSSGVPEACEGVDRGVNASVPNCACRDRYTADCSCKLEEPGRYFACVGGDRAEMPCTRHAHCNNKDGTPGGLCNGNPVCRPAGSVYKADPITLTGPACETDQNCAERTDGLTQCGFRLFDLSAQGEATDKSLIQLEHRLKHGGKKRRGTCVSAPGDSCNNLDDNADPQGCQSGECRGYRLEVAPP
jgi:hypothetical protein